MFKSRFILRNVVAGAICLVGVMLFSGCKDKGNGIGTLGKTAKLAPPAWIQGKWGAEGIEVFKFTSDDVFTMGVSLKTIWNYNVGVSSVSLKETKNTSSLYEITITAKAMGQESVSGYYSFKKGDGTYIEAASNETGTPLTNDDYGRLDKIN